MEENWVDIPAAPTQPHGPKGAKQILLELSTTFSELKVSIKDVLQDGNEIVVRSEITGIQTKPFMSVPAKNRKLVIQAVDIHEFKDGKIVRTWHTEDWLTGLHQLGAFENWFSRSQIDGLPFATAAATSEEIGGWDLACCSRSSAVCVARYVYRIR